MGITGYFYDIINGRARLASDKTAIIDRSKGRRKEHTYRDLSTAAGKLASGLKRNGIREGARIAVLAPNIIEYIHAYTASARVNTSLVPLNYRLAPPELRHMINQTKPKAIIVDQDFYEKAIQIKEALKDIPLKAYIGNEPPSSEFEPLETLYNEDSLDKPLKPLKDEDVAFILYTGGSTGTPKGAIITHRQVYWNAVNTVLSWGLQPDDIAPVFFPLFHTGGWNVITIPMFYIGGTLVFTRYFQAKEALQVIEEDGATIVIAVPTMFYEMARLPEFEKAKFQTVRFFKSGGGMSPSPLMEKYLAKGKPYYQGYGLTEAGPNLLYTPPEIIDEAPMSVGKQGLFAEMKILDEEGRVLPPGSKGELLVRGPVTFSGYLDMPDETRKTILPDGWVRTGDIFMVDGKGYFYFVERKKYMIKTGGENVYPTEVEEEIRKHPDIIDVAVFGVPDPKWGEAVAALIVSRKPIDPMDLKKWLKTRLAGYKVPKYIWFVSELPKTAVGKIDYTGIRNKYSMKTAEAIKL